MEFSVLHQGEIVGLCRFTELGLYWNVECHCKLLSDRVQRLYWNEHRLGVLERQGNELCLSRHIAKKSLPGFPGETRSLYLQPPVQILDCRLPPTKEKDGRLWYPYQADGPFPCMPLACFFSLEREGERDYWVISREPDCRTL